MSMKIEKILGLRVAVKRKQPEEITKSGLLLSVSEEKMYVGEVVHLGSGEQKDDKQITIKDIKVGDCVIFQKWGGTEIETNEGAVVIVNYNDIMAVVNKGE